MIQRHYVLAAGCPKSIMLIHHYTSRRKPTSFSGDPSLFSSRAIVSGLDRLNSALGHASSVGSSKVLGLALLAVLLRY